jgi:hypothetical protein
MSGMAVRKLYLAFQSQTRRKHRLPRITLAAQKERRMLRERYRTATVRETVPLAIFSRVLSLSLSLREPVPSPIISRL